MSTSTTQVLARATVRAALGAAPTSTVHVLDVDGGYAPVGHEQVLTPRTLGVDLRELHVRTVLLEREGLLRWLQPALLRHLLHADPTALAVSAGVLLLTDPAQVPELADPGSVLLVARCAGPLPADGTWPGPADLLDRGSYSPGLIGVGRAGADFLDLWEALAADPMTASDRWLDVAASLLPHRVLREPRVLVSAWTDPSARFAAADDGTLLVDGEPVVAVDLTSLDPAAPWLLEADAPAPPRLRLSERPPLAKCVARYATEVGLDPVEAADAAVTSLGLAVDPQLRAAFRAALDASPARSIDALPDPFDPASSSELAAWLTEPAAGGGDLGLGRYLASIYAARPDLRVAFPGVPGEHVEAFLAWAEVHGRTETTYSAGLLELAVDAARRTEAARGPHAGTRRHPGVNVVGYLRAELGVGESARRMLAALEAGGIPHATASVDRHLQSRQRAMFAETATAPQFDTTLLCVNADMTPAVSASIPGLLEHSYRIGMWYWEVEDFPASQHAGFGHVDEVWVATDFVRRAIEPHSPVPVRTITPPLPQPQPDRTRTRTDLGLPERPYFLFTFDYLSTVERKNPWGLVDAFEAAFAPGEGPVLVIKSINADRRPGPAERLRLRVAESPDVVLLEEYLTAPDRDALVALCACYVSLHRSEGLGLTMAEAMALGRPVIATGYSGNLQFMTEANSFLVPWTPVTIPDGCEPYPAGGTWAEPDLRVATQLMRAVLADPELAAARGRRAAQDIASLHSPEVTGRQIAERLAELVAARRARRRLGGRDLRALARRTLSL